MALYPTSIRLPENTRTWLNAGIFVTRHMAARVILNTAPNLYIMTLYEIRGRFGLEELQLILDLSPRIQEDDTTGQVLIQLIKQYQVMGSLPPLPDLSGFCSRIRRLTTYQGAVLQWWAGGYHHLAKRGATGQQLQEYIQRMLDAEEEP